MNDNGGRDRLAWAVLITTFVIWLALVIAIPVLVSRHLQAATRPLELQLQVNQGTVRVTGAEETTAVFAGDPPVSLEVADQIVTNAADGATLLAYVPEEAQLLSLLQIYGNTSLNVELAEAPRYGLSDRPQRLHVYLGNGRVRFRLPPNPGRVLELVVRTPQGEVSILEAGSYAVEVSNVETQVVVLEGRAVLQATAAAAEELALAADERAVIPVDGPPAGPLSPERNLIRNGNFGRGLENWDELAWNIELGEQPAGKTEIANIAGEAALRFNRVGEGHADVGVRQVVNQDVTDYSSLRLEVSLRVMVQTVAVCGSLGSECPLTVRVEYEDTNGNVQVWQQGFFANGQFGQDGTPDVCLSCPPPRPGHQQVTSGQFAFYRGELLELLPQYGMLPPSRIKSISILAAGHTFDVEVLDVSIIAEEQPETEPAPTNP